MNLKCTWSATNLGLDRVSRYTTNSLVVNSYEYIQKRVVDSDDSDDDGEKKEEGEEGEGEGDEQEVRGDWSNY